LGVAKRLSWTVWEAPTLRSAHGDSPGQWKMAKFDPSHAESKPLNRLQKLPQMIMLMR